MSQVLDFVPIWTLILGMAVFLYVMLDGFDLGVGMLYGFAPNTASRNTIMNSIAPVWDGIETWLVFGGLRSSFAFGMPSTRRFGIMLSLTVRALPLLRRAWCSAVSFRDTRSRAGRSRATPSLS